MGCFIFLATVDSKEIASTCWIQNFSLFGWYAHICIITSTSHISFSKVATISVNIIITAESLDLAKGSSCEFSQMAATTRTLDDLSLLSGTLAKRLSDLYDISPDRCTLDKADKVAWISLQLMGFLLLVGIEFVFITQALVGNESKVFAHELTNLHATSARDGQSTDTTVTHEHLESGIANINSSVPKRSTQARKYVRIPWFWLPVVGQLYLAYLITISCFGMLDIELTNGILAFLVATIASTWILAVGGLAGAIQETGEGDS